ncbi:site-specific DNA-methyltransferase [Mycoplasma mycoides subsp. capri]|uniref:DNA-methyltransferase n=1 Tax=Mycoplasma mycoides TaxID=2102 RepID=UPI001AF036B1|nr:site-specific DNA-methyltransferase [Mycoplasma mycoides subsp. capri]
MIKLNQVYNIDCLDGLKQLKDNSIDLVYLDPPFFTQKAHFLVDKTNKKYFFNDIWKDLKEYQEFLKIRLIEIKRVLKSTGSVFVHCDKTANHIIRVLLDEIFGSINFRSEIIWVYKRWSNSKKGLLDSHQNIYHYSKTNDFKFNVIYTDYSLTTNIDQILQLRVKDKNNKIVYKKDKNNNVVFSDLKKGVPLSDVWNIPFLNPKAKERTSYPTQKPIELLERIISLVTNENDVVLDPFVGSGTSVVASKLLNRNFIGFDINIDAIDITNQRLKNPIKSESNLLKNGIDKYDTKTKQQKQILSRYDCDIVWRNKGLDAILKQKINNKTVGIKIQKDSETLKQSQKLLFNCMKSKNLESEIRQTIRDNNNSFNRISSKLTDTKSIPEHIWNTTINVNLKIDDSNKNSVLSSTSINNVSIGVYDIDEITTRKNIWIDIDELKKLVHNSNSEQQKEKLFHYLKKNNPTITDESVFNRDSYNYDFSNTELKEVVTSTESGPITLSGKQTIHHYYFSGMNYKQSWYQTKLKINKNNSNKNFVDWNNKDELELTLYVFIPVPTKVGFENRDYLRPFKIGDLDGAFIIIDKDGSERRVIRKTLLVKDTEDDWNEEYDYKNWKKQGWKVEEIINWNHILKRHKLPYTIKRFPDTELNDYPF